MLNRGGFNRFKFNSQTATVVANGAVTIGLRYCVVATQAVTKQSSYTIGIPEALTVTARYAIRETTTRQLVAQYVIVSTPITLIQLTASYVMDVYPYYEGDDPYIRCRCCPELNPYSDTTSPYNKDNKPYGEVAGAIGPTKTRKYSDGTPAATPKRNRPYTPFIDL